MSRESFQRLALVTILVLLAALASDRLMRFVPSAFAHGPFRHVHAHGMDAFAVDFHLPEHELARIEAEVEAELADAAREMEEEARQMAEEVRFQVEEARREAEEHRLEAGERCRIEREHRAEMR